MNVYRTILIVGMGCGLWVTSAVAEEPPAWYPKTYELFGPVVTVDHDGRSLVIDEEIVVFDSTLRVHMTGGSHTGATRLRRGMVAGVVRFDPDRPIQELWVMPHAAE